MKAGSRGGSRGRSRGGSSVRSRGRGRQLRRACLLAAGLSAGAGIVLSLMVGRSYPGLTIQHAPFGRVAYVPAFDPIADVTLGLPMDAGNDNLGSPTPAIRAIMVYPTQAVLLAGGRAVRAIPMGSATVTLDQLQRLVADPGWLAAAPGGKVVLHAAVVVHAGAVLRVAPPTREVVLENRQGVFLGAAGEEAGDAHLHLEGVRVRASDGDVPRRGSEEAVSGDLGRPFVYANHALLTIERSQFRWLGRDWNGSYGVSWSAGSTGYARDSMFEDNFIGAYSDHAVNLSIQRSVFRDNALYGIDPHSFSSHVVVDGNLAERNGRHGIIFSDHVTGGTVRNNIARDNGLNGIMMDEASTGNLITKNVVTGNRSDGIVIADSADNTVRANDVSRNRVGIHVRGVTSTGQVLAANEVHDNIVAVQGVRAGAGNDLSGNGGTWLPSVLLRIWSGAAAMTLLLSGLSAVAMRRAPRPVRVLAEVAS